MADTRSLRITTAATFLPAFPLLLAHGVVSSSPAPAVGLVPLAVSASTSIFLLSRAARKQQSAEPERGGVQEGYAQEAQLEQEPGLEQEFAQQPQERPEAPAPTSNRNHPILVFAVDTILAAALMVVLVFTWIDSSSGSTNSAESAMLAAYGTIPLLINL